MVLGTSAADGRGPPAVVELRDGSEFMADDLITPIPGDVREADLGTHRLAYADLGSGEPVIFMHGGLIDHQSWGNQLPLADNFRIILPDTRGHGRSGGANLPATYAAFADDVIALMDRLGLARATLVGFSDGGCSALHAVLRYPDRIANLVIIGTPYNIANYSPGVVDHFHAMTAEQVEASAWPLLKEMITKIRAHMADQEWKDYWQRVVKGLWVSEPDFALSDFADMRVRTLILHGENEKSFGREISEELAATIPDCQLLYVPDASHPSPQENPGFVNDAILRFLRR
jgi:pimeloyl-ACP methyl ester carboxylesterase